MARKEVIRKESWNYILYKYGTRRLLTVIFWGSFIDVSRSFWMGEEIDQLPADCIRHLADKIRNNYTQFKSIEITPEEERAMSSNEEFD